MCGTWAVVFYKMPTHSWKKIHQSGSLFGGSSASSGSIGGATSSSFGGLQGLLECGHFMQTSLVYFTQEAIT